ncbi:MAG: hypothetical protein AB8B72_02355 [Crocinitomicaceae bacterium]
MFRVLKIGLFCGSLFWSGAILAQKNNQFAIGLMPGGNNSLLSFAIVTYSGGTYIGTKRLSEQQFMFFALGYWPTRANPNKENLFKKNGIRGVELTYDDFGKVNGYTKGPIFQLWRIKYMSHPARRDLPSGWSQSPYMPSKSQAIYLYETYGVLNVNTHFFVGEKLFQLLKDVQDPTWVSAYQAI